MTAPVPAHANTSHTSGSRSKTPDQNPSTTNTRNSPEPLDRPPLTLVFQVERMPSSGRAVREYVAVYGCLRALTAAVVAVTVAVRDTGRPSAHTRGVG